MTDNREILNEAEVDFLLQGAAEDVVDEAPVLEDGNQTVTMHGDLDQISLADIFQTLAMSKMEGVLRVRNPLEERQVYCRDGYVRILVPPRLTLRRLGQRLIQAGLIQPDELRQALLLQRKEKVPLGQLLVREGMLSQDDLDDIIGVQVAEDLFALFTWQHGTFEFFKGDPNSDVLRSQFEACPEYEVNSLLLEVARRSDEWQSILESIGSCDEIPQVLAEVDDPDSLEEAHTAVLQGIDGTSTYRQLSDYTTFGLFEFARAARDLAAGGIIGNIPDTALIAVATELAEEGEGKRAIVLLQTLRDRPGDRDLSVVAGMAQVLEAAGERRFASSLLLEAAQRTSVPEEALDLARQARNLVPYDPGTLSFLRTVLVAHGEPDSAELEKVTADLLDALIDGDLATTALEIVEDARMTGTLKPLIMRREARARQKLRDTEGACNVLVELADHYLAEDDRPKAIETLEALVRMDRSRRDIAKQLAGLKRTKTGSAIRLGAALLTAGLIGAMGFVWWQQGAYEQAIEQASQEITALLEKGDRAAARQSLEKWRGSIGECELMQDMESRVAFAEGAEQKRLERLRRSRINDQLTAAAEALGRGELRTAMNLYGTTYREDGMADEVREVVGTRITALLDDLQRTSKELQDRLPADPTELFDRKQLTENLAKLQSICPPALQRSFEELTAMTAEGLLPEFVDKPLLQRCSQVVTASEPAIAKAQERSAAYVAALQRNDTQRRLDPMFKAAVEKEEAYDFAGALELYRTLESQPTGDADLRTHFRDRVTRNATIVRLLGELSTATDAGDFETAQQQLRALRLSYPEVPFDKIARLPLAVRSQPDGATVSVNGAEVGKTPLLLARIPAETAEITVAMNGFASAQQSVTGDDQSSWTAQLLLTPTATWRHEGAIEVAPVPAPDQTLLFSDRSGNVLRVPATLDATTWTFATGDLSGWLTRPVLDGEQVLVASLDGKLRALALQDGKELWSLPDLPTEVQPVQVGRALALATTDGRLHAIDLEKKRRLSVDLPQPAHEALFEHKGRLVSVGERAQISCWSLPELKSLWQIELPDLVGPHVQRAGNLLIVGDDQGRLFAIDLDRHVVAWQRDLGVSTIGGFAIGGDKIWLTTHEQLLRLELLTGKDLAPIARGKLDWAGEPLVVGSRAIVPLRNEQLQVLQAETGAPLYRLAGGKRCRLLASGPQVLVCGTDHVVASYTLR